MYTEFLFGRGLNSRDEIQRSAVTHRQEPAASLLAISKAYVRGHLEVTLTL